MNCCTNNANNMGHKLILIIIYLATWLLFGSCEDIVNDTEALANSTDPNKDMYVIHAMVYQVGIVTNRTDNETANLNATNGQQEALTFYHNNGSQVDLSKIPEPLLTNVKAQSIVGVAPVSSSQDSQDSTPNQLPWGALSRLTNTASLPHPMQELKESHGSIKTVRDVHPNLNLDDDAEISFNNLYKRMFKRETMNASTPVAISKGSAVIPKEAGVQSIAIPPLLTLNNNMSEIPVPIPNTSIVHYSKINTLVTKP